MDYSYSYDYGYDMGSAVSTGVEAVFGLVAFIWIIAMAVGIFGIICNWKIFKKAGKQGWEAIVPIYNIVVLLEITNLPMWYIPLFFIPIGNIIALFLIYIELAKKFGQSAAFGVGLVFLSPIFLGILAFNKNYVYQGVGAASYGQPYNGQPMNNGQMYKQQPMYNQPVNNGQPTMVNPQPVMPNQQVQSNCSRCGAPVNAGDKFCMNCGNQIM